MFSHSHSKAYCGYPLEENNNLSAKRKASEDEETPANKRLCLEAVSNVTSSAQNKRKANEDMEMSSKKRKTTHTDASPQNTVQVGNVSSSEPLTKEEEILRLSSTGNGSYDDFNRKYAEYTPLGSGRYSTVFCGFRRTDSFQVAIKHVPWDKIVWEDVAYNGKTYRIIMEVAVMLKMNPSSSDESACIRLLDWFLFQDELIIVMERDDSFTELDTYMANMRRPMGSLKAKSILKELVNACMEMEEKGVFHRDLNLSNILVNITPTETKVKIIDFGWATFIRRGPYTLLCGTPECFAPELFDFGMYSPCATNVWQLGAIFHSLLHGQLYFSTAAFCNGCVPFGKRVSRDCKELLTMCLIRNPDYRARLLDLHARLNYCFFGY